MSDAKNAHPDADIHPVATGEAAKTVEAHKDEQTLKMYSGWFCPFVQRAWLVLEEKKIPYQYIEVNPYHKPKSLLDLNPRGLVPTFEYHNKPVYESTVIIQLLEEAFPSHGPSLQPADLYERARMRIWQDYAATRIVPAFHRLLQYQPARQDGFDAGLEALRAELQSIIKDFTREMHPEGPYFMGAQPMLVDFVVAPWVVRMWVFDEFKGGSGIPAKDKWGPDEEVWRRWWKYVDAIEGRESVGKTLSDKEHYMPIYKRYAGDKAQSEMAKNMRAGRGVP